LVISPVKLLRSPITPEEKFWTLFTMEAAKSEPGRLGIEETDGMLTGAPPKEAAEPPPPIHVG
jgi:hypothetical protein